MVKTYVKILATPLLLIFSFHNQIGWAQTFAPNTTTSYNSCSGIFYDSGGTNGNYSNNQNYTVTFCSGTGQAIYLAFTQFSTEAGFDIVTIYNGPNTGSPILGTFSGVNSPGTIVASSGCITIRFVSDNSVPGIGWAATIGCGNPPPSPNMSNASIVSCSGNFYDSGGASANYGNNQNLTYTVCPSIAGNKVQVSFSSFSLENNYDFLQIYDGPNVSSPSLGTYTGLVSPGIVTATNSNVSGCLTFRFTSDISISNPGWIATIGCIAPCQLITSNFVSSTPSADADGIIRICQGEIVSFVGSGTFSNSSLGANYQWNLGNGSVTNGTTASTSYTNAGSYTVNLNITDPFGCSNSNLNNIKVQVATTPLVVTSSIPDPLCIGDSASINAQVTMVPYIQNCTPPVSGTTFLPDGTGASYSTSVSVNCYENNQFVTAASDIQNVCLNMEHSYIGDLTLTLICPNGQSTILKSYPGGTTNYLGCPLDDPTVGPGIGSIYCFTPNASTLLVNGLTTNCGTPSSPSINSGDYMPSQPFSNLIGCPLNGSWTIQVTDNLALDNGYIFNWDINFNSSISIDPNNSFTPTILSQGWVSNPLLTSTNSTSATVTPTVSGITCLTYSVTDNFGCTTFTDECITVLPFVIPTFTQLGPYCQGATPGLLPTSSTNGITGTWSSVISTSNAGSIVYTFTPTEGQCASATTMTVVIYPPPFATISAPPILCSGGTTAINISAVGGVEPYVGIGIYSVAAGTYTYTVTDANGCASTVTITLADPTPISLPALTHN